MMNNRYLQTQNDIIEEVDSSNSDEGPRRYCETAGNSPVAGLIGKSLRMKKKGSVF